jgi:thioredoxin 1
MLPSETSATVLDRILAADPRAGRVRDPGCGPCEQLRPALDQLAREYHDRALIVRIVDSSEGWLAARYHLSFVPTLLFFRGAAEQCRIKGDPGPGAIRAHLDFLLTGACPPEPAEGRHTLRRWRPPGKGSRGRCSGSLGCLQAPGSLFPFRRATGKAGPPALIRALRNGRRDQIPRVPVSLGHARVQGALG